MGIVDIVLLLVILLVAFNGFYNGFVHEVFSLVGVVLGVFFASYLALPVGVFINEQIYHINSPTVSVILGFVAILALFWVVFLFIGFILSKFVKLSGLGILDRVLGYLFSCAKVFCILGFIFFGLNEIKFIKEIDFVKTLPERSKVYSGMLDCANLFVRFASSEEIVKRLSHLDEVGESASQKAAQIMDSPQVKKGAKQIKDGIETVQKEVKDGVAKSAKDAFNSLKEKEIKKEK